MPVKTPVKPPVEPEKMMRPKESAASAMIDKIPIALVLTLASPYLAGQKPEEAIELAHKIRSQSGYTSTLDILGEDMDSDLTCDASVEQYKKLADAICANPIKVENVENAEENDSEKNEIDSSSEYDDEEEEKFNENEDFKKQVS